ncbi:hypothetical protein PIB30_023569 [Stylosanthes scabra]|uniref:Uncharacterized protein n=1 Tax=Stylosanthes scabra TaxID=79078 RepID=A0ABU6X8N4_9FABA|nr:hypothetical protein [Stylosanthes scabra]
MHNKERTVAKPYPVKRVLDNVGSRVDISKPICTSVGNFRFSPPFETWDVFDTIFRDKLCILAYPSAEPFLFPVQSVHFDLDFPYDYPISLMRPNGGILHPSPPQEPYYSPPRDSFFSQFGFDPNHFEIHLVPPLSYYPPVYFPPGQDGYDYAPYDPPVDLVPVKIEPRSPPPAPVDTGVIGEPYDPLDDFDGFIAQYFQDPQGGAVAPMEEDSGEDPMDEDEQDAEMVDTDSEDEDPSEVDELSASLEAVSLGARSTVSTDTCESRV